MPDFNINIRNDEAVAAALEKSPQVFFAHFRKAFVDASNEFVRVMRTTRLTGRPGLKVATGTLRRSLSKLVSGTNLQNLRTSIFFDQTETATKNGGSYAQVHEYGALIRPKKGKYLFIPVRAGSPVALGAKASGKGGKSFSSQIAGFRLAKQVYIPPRLGFLATWGSFENQVRIFKRLQTARAGALEEVAANG